ncbi:MAG: helix-turn-helix transcriptional regulator [Candidatus Gastranaerophilales bacterium]|nr:helix-turn-helix transcriptional regulator [Candidatus Gastranaerophilales bacterium]
MDFKEQYQKLGKQIKFLREEKRLTQEKLAERAEISLDYLGKIEVSINCPGLVSLFKIAKALGVRVKDLFDFE